MINERRILVVDDDADILDLLKYNLVREGFKVTIVENSSDTLLVAEQFQPDLIILDLMMPGINGLQLCERIRHHHQLKDTYIFFLTAKSGADVEQIALDRGGDDFIEKLAGIRSLIYKIRSVLRDNVVISKRINEIVAGEITISRRTNNVFYKGHFIHLTQAEFEILFLLVQNSGKSFTAESITHHISNGEIHLAEPVVFKHIDNLKKKISPHLIAGAPRFQFIARGLQ